MRKLGEQWIEEIDGKRHMYKCIGLNDDMSEIIKDLGILNEDGCLACPFCGAFPIVRCIEEQEGECIVAQAFCPKGDLEIQEPEGKGHVLWFMRTTLQQAIDAWNRRA